MAIPGECSTPFGITDGHGSSTRRGSGPSSKCSTPFGIKEVGTSLVRSRSNPNLQCSTPFGIKGSARSVGGPPVGGSVLNAFRHHRIGTTLAICASRQDAAVCSTPFGITEVGTLDRQPARTRVIGAQRLSASQRSAHRHGSRRRRAPAVLNAFRHHRGRHLSVAATVSVGAWCAQRLSASQRSARSTAARRRSAAVCSTPFGIKEVGTRRRSSMRADGASAQRLSASKDGHRPGRRDRRRRAGAQRLSASKRSASIAWLERHARRPVLNAFRHQRRSARCRAGKSPIADRCSTPFGIKGWSTAFDSPAASHRAARCSTPFGIKGWSTRRELRANRRLSMCSTPFGIKGWSHAAAAGYDYTALVVLNAFRHQRMVHADGDAGRQAVMLSAQRLSASKDGPLSVCGRVSAAHRRCSTPFGIKGWSTRVLVPAASSYRCAQRLSASKDGPLGQQ